MVLPVVHHPDYTAPLPPGAFFPMDKYSLTMDALHDSGVALTVHMPEETPLAALLAVHTQDYVEAILNGTLGAEETRRIGFPITPRVVRRSLLASGGTWLAARWARLYGYAANTAGGSHHAHAGFGAGFCVFNDIAIAARRLLDAGDARRILVVDLDVHQGDGTAAIFADDPRVFTFSMHCQANFPARKASSDLDVGLPIGTDDTHYLEMLAHHLPDVLAQAEPDLIFYLAGVDPHINDRLGRLALTDNGLADRDSYVASAAQSAGTPLVSVMGGGYGDDKLAVARRHAQTILTLGHAYSFSPKLSLSDHTEKPVCPREVLP
jgi:acetoin utilization deacetylase AcuC-like enzyme